MSAKKESKLKNKSNRCLKMSKLTGNTDLRKTSADDDAEKRRKIKDWFRRKDSEVKWAMIFENFLQKKREIETAMRLKRFLNDLEIRSRLRKWRTQGENAMGKKKIQKSGNEEIQKKFGKQQKRKETKEIKKKTNDKPADEVVKKQTEIAESSSNNQKKIPLNPKKKPKKKSKF